MGLLTTRHARRLALLATYAAGLVIVAAVYATLWTPGTLGLSTTRSAAGPPVVAWVSPDGPAWSAGARPGDTVIRGGQRDAHELVIQHGGRRITLGLDTTRVHPLDLLVSALGLCIVLFGALVLTNERGQDRRAARTFWRMSTLIGLSLGVVPAGFHGAPWAIALSFVTLVIFGPALLDLSLVFPSTTAPPRHRPLIWLPALAPLLLYPLCWWRPVPLFSFVSIAGNVLFVGYILAACGRLIWVWRHPRSALQRVRLQWLALGLILGFLPLVALNLLPGLLVGHDLLPPQVSVLALVLLPFSVGVAIVRTEFLGVTALIHRRPLHVLVCVVLLIGVAAVAGSFAITAARPWGWSAPATATVASLLTALGALILRPGLTRRAERLLLRDVYDPADVALRVSADLSRAPTQVVGALAVTHLVTIFDLEFALLLTDRDTYLHAHTRNLVPAAALDGITRRAQVLLAAAAPVQAIMDVVVSVPVLLLPIGDDQRTWAVLCCGPKHSGDCYTRQDVSLFHALGYRLSDRFQFQARLDEQHTILHALQEANVAAAQEIAAPVVQAISALIIQEPDAPAGDPLTRCELRVLLFLAQGLGNKEIADRLNRTVGTVEKHVKNARRRLGARTIPDVIARAHQQGLLPPE